MWCDTVKTILDETRRKQGRCECQFSTPYVVFLKLLNRTNSKRTRQRSTKHNGRKRHVPIIKVIKITATKQYYSIERVSGNGIKHSAPLFAYSIPDAHLDSNRVYENNNAMRHACYLLQSFLSTWIDASSTTVRSGRYY